MKLLMYTRKIDSRDERVSFVTDWILELAKNLNKLIIICQETGDLSNLPDNIKNSLWYIEKECHLVIEIEFMEAIDEAKNWSEAKVIINERFQNLIKEIYEIKRIFYMNEKINFLVDN